MGDKPPDVEGADRLQALVAEKLEKLLEIEGVVPAGVVRRVALSTQVAEKPFDWLAG